MALLNGDSKDSNVNIRTYAGSDTKPFGLSPAAFQFGYLTLALMFGLLAAERSVVAKSKVGSIVSSYQNQWSKTRTRSNYGPGLLVANQAAKGAQFRCYPQRRICSHRNKIDDPKAGLLVATSAMGL